MKKVMFVFAASIVMAACGGSGEQVATDSTSVKDSLIIDTITVDSVHVDSVKVN